MEIKQLDDLVDNPRNPRFIKDREFEALKQSISKFGDLSSIVFNVRTQQLIGGHMRVKAFRALQGQKRVVIEHRFDVPNRHGTIAIGHVELDGELYKYREVDWSPEWAEAAGIAANHIMGEDNSDLLAQVAYDLKQLENGDDLLALTGLADKEIEKLLQSVGVGDDPETASEDQPDETKNEKLSFALSPDQREVVELALQQAKQANDIPHTNLDNINGTALYYVCKDYAETSTSQNSQQATDTPAADTQTDQTASQTFADPSTPDLTSIPTV